jgi:hypothetical protein
LSIGQIDLLSEKSYISNMSLVSEVSCQIDEFQWFGRSWRKFYRDHFYCSWRKIYSFGYVRGHVRCALGDALTSYRTEMMAASS